MNLKIPGSLSWAAFLEMGARHENSPNPKAPSVMMGLFFFVRFTTLIIVSPLLCRKSGFQLQQKGERGIISVRKKQKEEREELLPSLFIVPEWLIQLDCLYPM